MTRKSLVVSALVLAVVTAATVAYAGSALQLYVGCGLDYIKHVNFNSGSGAQTILLLKNEYGGDTNVQIKIGARATDGTTLWQTRTINLRCGETRSLSFVWSKNITDLNFIQLIRLSPPQKRPTTEP